KPLKSLRAVRYTAPYSACTYPFRPTFTLASTTTTPDGFAIRRGPRDEPANRWAKLPGIRLATARQIAPVIGTARWGRPTHIMRMQISKRLSSSTTPESVLVVVGRLIIATLGTPVSISEDHVAD